MRSKTLFSAIILAIVVALCCVGPFSVSSAIETLSAAREAETKRDTYGRNLTTMENVVLDAVNAYNETRDFDIYYGDVASIQKIFSGLSGIEVQSITVVNPMDYYKDMYPWEDGEECSAVRFELLVSDIDVTVSALTKMQLPIEELYIEYPSKVNMVFLTGGAV